MEKFIKPDKSEIQDQEGISKHIVDFYQTLYKSTSPNNQHKDNYIKNTNVETLDSLLSGDIDGEITIQDIDAVVGSLKNNKSPGWEGSQQSFIKNSGILSVKFYITPILNL